MFPLLRYVLRTGQAPNCISLTNSYPALTISSRNVNYVTHAMPEFEEDQPDPKKPSKWLSYNDIIFPPTLPGEQDRPAYVCHMKKNIKYSPKKLWYIACLVRGMSVDEAIKQLDFVIKKGAIPVRETILEAQQLAVEKHNVEFKTNLWVAESFVGKGEFIRGIRRHARLRVGEVEYKYSSYYVRLEEGKPPENYYNQPKMDKDSLLARWLESMRSRRVISSL